MLLTFIVFLALFLDYVFGEPKRFHPLVAFGSTANWLEKKFNIFSQEQSLLSRLSGALTWSVLVLPPVTILYIIEQLSTSDQVNFIVGLICLTFAVGFKSLVQHAKAVLSALEKKDIGLARRKAAMIVSRDTSASDERAIVKATVESVLENGSDSVFAAIFWFIILGAPGVIFYRLANTLDAMWGYKNARFNSFGWAAARIDDVLNWIPAKLTALSYALSGNINSAFKCWYKQARHWKGVNPGVVMASGAGALKIKLGGTAVYHGSSIDRPELGCKNDVEIKDISRSINLLVKSIFIWMLVIAMGDFFIV